MQVHLEVDDNYAAQFVGVLQSLDSRFFKKVEIGSDSQFAKDKSDLQQTLKKIDEGKANMISLDEFDANMDKVLGEYENQA